MADFYKISGKTFFDRGIDDIVFQAENPNQSLPDQQTLMPAERFEEQFLNRLFNQAGIDTLLDEQARPDLQDRDILQPNQFRSGLEQAGQILGERAAALREQDPESAKILNRAVRLLSENRQLDELFKMYRNALFEG
jgi:type III secretion protein X